MNEDLVVHVQAVERKFPGVSWDTEGPFRHGTFVCGLEVLISSYENALLVTFLMEGKLLQGSRWDGNCQVSFTDFVLCQAANAVAHWIGAGGLSPEFLRQLDPQIREAVLAEILLREKQAEKLLGMLKKQVDHQHYVMKMMAEAKVNLS